MRSPGGWSRSSGARPSKFYVCGTVPANAPESGPYAPQIVIDGGSEELEILNLRERDSGEVLAYSIRSGSGCRTVTVVDTQACVNGSCVRVNSTTPKILTLRSTGSIEAADASMLALLVEGAKQLNSGTCSLTGSIMRAVDTGSSVQLTTVAIGVMPAAT